MYPASYAAPNVVAVAAINNQDALASFSNYGANSVHLGAPGVQMLSTLLARTYGYLNGTSMATPHVSGAAALLLSRCTANTAAVKSLLLNNVDQIPALSGMTITGGRLNLGRAIDACGPAGNTSPIVTLTDPSNDTTYLCTCEYRPPRSGVRWAGRRRPGGVLRRHCARSESTRRRRSSSRGPIASVGNYALTAVATDNDGATEHVGCGQHSRTARTRVAAFRRLCRADSWHRRSGALQRRR